MKYGVFLRNGEAADVERKDCAVGFGVLGKRRAEGSGLEMWTKDGHWREDRTEHPFDIVLFVNPDGQIVRFTGEIPQ